MKTALTQAARNIFDYFQGKADINQVQLSIEYLHIIEMPAHKNLVLPQVTSQQESAEFDYSALFSSFNASKIIDDWSDVFSTDKSITNEEANLFIKSLFSSIDLDTPFFTYQNIIHYCSRFKGRWTDFHILRPKRKAGWSLHFTLEGSGSYNFIRKEFKSTRGDLVLFSPSAYLDACRSEDNQSWTYFSIMFQPTEDMLELLKWPEISDGIYYLKEKSEDRQELLISILKTIYQQGKSNDRVDVLARAAGIKMMLLQCSKLLEGNRAEIIDSRVLKAMEYVEKRLFKPLTIEEVAKEACLSTSGLSQLFKKYQGVSIMQWREEKRIAEACEKLLTTSDSMSQISFDLGYVSQAYFSRCFSKHMKRSPSEYRKLYSLLSF